jgi:RNA polymerase sigma-70 factor (ECF subfamily)
MSDDRRIDEFETNREHLRAVAYRMLGSAVEADDAVQEAWLRFSRSDTDSVDNLGAWLTTVTSRVCLDMLRARRSRREETLAGDVGRDRPAVSPREDPEAEAVLAASVGPALLVVLEALAPAERIAFVLHDLFGVPFDEIAPIVGRSPVAARQLASRARRRVRGATATGDVRLDRQREIVDAFLAAAREGRFDALLELLDPEVVFRDPGVGPDGPREVVGADDVAAQFAGRAHGADIGPVEGAIGIVVAPGGRLRMAMRIEFRDDRISGFELIGDPERLASIDADLDADLDAGLDV